MNSYGGRLLNAFRAAKKHFLSAAVSAIINADTVDDLAVVTAAVGSIAPSEIGPMLRIMGAWKPKSADEVLTQHVQQLGSLTDDRIEKDFDTIVQFLGNIALTNRSYLIGGPGVSIRRIASARRTELLLEDRIWILFFLLVGLNLLDPRHFQPSQDEMVAIREAMVHVSPGTKTEPLMVGQELMWFEFLSRISNFDCQLPADRQVALEYLALQQFEEVLNDPYDLPAQVTLLTQAMWHYHQSPLVLSDDGSLRWKVKTPFI